MCCSLQEWLQIFDVSEDVLQEAVLLSLLRKWPFGTLAVEVVTVRQQGLCHLVRNGVLGPPLVARHFIKQYIPLAIAARAGCNKAGSTILPTCHPLWLTFSLPQVEEEFRALHRNHYHCWALTTDAVLALSLMLLSGMCVLSATRHSRDWCDLRHGPPLTPGFVAVLFLGPIVLQLARAPSVQQVLLPARWFSSHPHTAATACDLYRANWPPLPILPASCSLLVLLASWLLSPALLAVTLSSSLLHPPLFQQQLGSYLWVAPLLAAIPWWHSSKLHMGASHPWLAIVWYLLVYLAVPLLVLRSHELTQRRQFLSRLWDRLSRTAWQQQRNDMGCTVLTGNLGSSLAASCSSSTAGAQ